MAAITIALAHPLLSQLLEEEAPSTRYHVERDGLFIVDDRHDGSSYSAVKWGPFESPFTCAWDTAEEASRWAAPVDTLRRSYDGCLLLERA